MLKLIKLGKTIFEDGNKTLKHTKNNSQQAGNLIYSSQIQMENKNYIDPITRKRINNKTDSVARQASSFVTKQILQNKTIIVIEDDFIAKKVKDYDKLKESKSRIVKKLAINLSKKSVQKLRQEMVSNSLFNGLDIDQINSKIEVKNISTDNFGIVSTSNTSKMCSNCVFDPSDSWNYDEFINDVLVNKKVKFNLLDYRKDNQNEDKKIIDSRSSKIKEFAFLFEYDFDY